MAKAEATPFSGLYARLVRNTAEPKTDNGCWTWTARSHGRPGYAYPLVNVRVRGKVCTFKAHRVMLTLMELDGEWEHFADLYQLFSVAEFEAEHLCEGNPLCINPDHLEWLSKEEHTERTRLQRRGAWRRYRQGDQHGT